MRIEILCLLHFCRPGFSYSSYSTMEFKGLTSASHMSLPEAGYGSEQGYVGSEISGAVLGVTTPGASRLQASQSQERSTTMQRLHGSRGNHDSASGIPTDTLRLSGFSGAITHLGSLRVPPEVTFVASPQQTEDHPSECPYCGHRHWPGVHTCADCCVNAPANLKPGRESPSSSESSSSSQATYDFSSCFSPKFKKSAKGSFSRQMTYFFGFYGPKIGGGGSFYPAFVQKYQKP